VEVEERRRALEAAARDTTDRLAGRMPIPGAVPAETPADQAAALQTPVRNGTIRGFIPAGTRW
jgi:hypothetical protein